MILYYAPGACSLAVHIALAEMGVDHKLVAVDRSKQTSDGRDFFTINPKGYTPALELDDGSVITENPVILAYLAQTSGKLLPAEGLAHWRVLEATSYMACDIHKNFVPFFRPETTEAEKANAKAALDKHFRIVANLLGEKPFLVGDTMSIADAYLYVMLMWANQNKIAVPATLSAYFEKMNGRPSIKKALTEEGLI